MPQTSATPQRIEALRSLHSQAVETGQHLALDLKQTQVQHDQARDKLDNLRNYASEYRRQLQALESQGGDWSKVRDLRGFITKVDAAQTAQLAEINRIQALHAEKSKAWAAARQREKAYELLLAQQHVHVKSLAQKRALAEMQDWALNPQSHFVNTNQPTKF
ncbi:MAG: flagellar protein FliJ [Burkholderiales bacterium]|jgi:flagellar FliJ protein|nr:flagellar protein FliJ [Burkholderiales bacterium]